MRALKNIYAMLIAFPIAFVLLGVIRLITLNNITYDAPVSQADIVKLYKDFMDDNFNIPRSG